MDIIGETLFDIKTRGMVTTVSIDESFDINDKDALNLRLSELLETGSIWFLFDLSNIHYIQSFLLGIMVTINNTAEKKNGGVRLIHPSGPVRHVLDMARLTHFISEEETIEDAIEEISRN